nr:NAD(P)-binding domain-containing protein [Tamaricihabitans halophyticus]
MEMSTGQASQVTVLGLGAIGAAVSRVLLANGYRTAVWNRSADKATALVEHGARPAASAADAVATSELVILAVTDYAAARAVLEQVGAALTGKVLVNLTTGTPEGARRIQRMARERGADYLDGCVQGGADQVGTAEATLLYSGSLAAYEAHAATLHTLSTSSTFLGESVGTANLYDLAILNLWYESQSAFLHMLATFQDEGEPVKAFVPYAEWILEATRAGFADTATQVAESSYPVEVGGLAEHARVLGDLVEMREKSGVAVAPVAHLAGLVRQRLDSGADRQDLTSVIAAIRR